MRQVATTRQEAIKELLKKEKICDQKQLVHLLKEKFGIETNQVAVSRDFKLLGVLRKTVGKGFVYELPDIDVRGEILRLAIVDITHNETMIVITTQPGLADFVGDCLDEHSDLAILGCLSGENVVFVVPRSITEIEESYKKICEKMYFKK